MKEKQMYLTVKSERSSNSNYCGETSLTTNIAMAAHCHEQGYEVYLYPQMTHIKEFKIESVVESC